MLKRCVSVIVLCMATFVSAHADELAQETLKLCEKVKSCAMAAMEGQDLTPETLQMLQPMMDSMCAQVQGNVSKVPTGHPLYTPAMITPSPARMKILSGTR